MKTFLERIKRLNTGALPYTAEKGGFAKKIGDGVRRVRRMLPSYHNRGAISRTQSIITSTSVHTNNRTSSIEPQAKPPPPTSLLLVVSSQTSRETGTSIPVTPKPLKRKAINRSGLPVEVPSKTPQTQHNGHERRGRLPENSSAKAKDDIYHQQLVESSRIAHIIGLFGRRKLIAVLKYLNYTIDTHGGKGSHIKATYDALNSNNGQPTVIIVQKDNSGSYDINTCRQKILLMMRHHNPDTIMNAYQNT